MRKLLGTVFLAGIAFPFLLGNIHMGTGGSGTQLDSIATPAAATAFNKATFWFSTATNSPWWSDGTISRDVHTPDTISSLQGGAAAVVGGLVLGGHKLNGRAFVVSHIQAYVGVVSNGAGSTIIRVSDGAANCDTTLDCATVTNSTGLKDQTPTGTCSFASNAVLTYTVNSSTCVVTQPIIANVDVIGDWQ